MIRDGKTYVSDTTLQTWAVCTLKGVLRYVHGFEAEEVSAPLKAGNAAHAADEVFFKGGTVKEAIRKFRKEYKAWAEENIDPTDRFRRRFAYDNLSKILRYYFRTHPLKAFMFTVDPANVEVEFEMPLTKDGRIVSRGRLDAGPVVQKEDGKLFVLDHKHPGQINTMFLNGLRSGSQATNYIWAVQQHTAERVVGAIFNCIEFSQLPGLDSPETKCKNTDHGGVAYEECQPLHVKSELVVTHRSDAQIRAWKRTAIKLARQYIDASERYPDLSDIPKVPVEGEYTYNACNGCEFNTFCRTGRQVNIVESMFTRNPERV